jgi:type II secretory pathway predicted ATPase ExeA/cell division septation protein DedD
MSSPTGEYYRQSSEPGHAEAADDRQDVGNPGATESAGTGEERSSPLTTPMEGQPSPAPDVRNEEEQAPTEEGEEELDGYESFYGMREPPFTLTPNPAFFFVNERGQEGLKLIEQGIRRREGFAVICGDIGTGKTTLCWALLEKLEKMNVCTALVQNPMLSANDVLKCILHDLGVRPKGVSGEPRDLSDLFDTSWMAGMGEMELVERLNEFLVQMARKGLFTVVIIDEAQRLSMESLEQLRLLSNLEMADRKLLQIILVGQMELQQMLQKPELRQLNQRISVRFETRPLPRKDTADYIRHRLRVAWTIPRLQFKKRTFSTVYRLSRGYPRLINMICDRALSWAYQAESYVVTPRMVRRACKNIKRELYPAGIGSRIRRIIPFAGALLVMALLAVYIFLPRDVAPVKDSAPAAASRAVTAVPVAATDPASAKPVETPSADLPSPAVTKQPPAVDAPPTVAVADKAAVPGREEFLLQTASYRDRDSARVASEELKAKGFPSFFEYTETVAGGWYRVYAGPYSQLAGANKAVAGVKAVTGDNPILRRRTAK